jgi:prevent-host-death family protein
METFTVRDLREHTGDLIHDAEKGQLSLITKRGNPVFLAVPFSESLINSGLLTALAIHLFKESVLSLEKAAKIANIPIETFIEKCDYFNIPVVNYSAKEINKEWQSFE